MSISQKNIQLLKESTWDFKSIFEIMMSNQGNACEFMEQDEIINGLIVIIKI